LFAGFALWQGEVYGEDLSPAARRNCASNFHIHGVKQIVEVGSA